MHALTQPQNDNRIPSLARVKLEELVTRGRLQAGAVLTRIMAERPTDHLVPARTLGFRVDADTGVVHASAPGFDQPLHSHALRQVAVKAGLPATYLDRLLDRDNRAWGPSLLTTNLHELFANTGWEGEKLLFRSVAGVTRGVVSSKYRRLDSPIVVDAFCQACAAIGAVPSDGFATDTRISIRAIVPKIFEPLPGEVLVFGMNLQSSDFGAGSLVLNLLVVRLVCSNGLLLDRALRQVHLGKRIDDTAQFSATTHELDARTVASGVNDVVRAQLAPARLDELQRMVQDAGATSMTGAEVEAHLRKLVTKPEAKSIADAFDSDDVVAMPAGRTRWRLAQAMSWIAGRTQDPVRRTELMTVAGAALLAA